MGGLPFLEYLSVYRTELIFNTEQHALLSVYVVVAAAVVGLLVAIVTYRSSFAATVAIGISSVAFTLPSIALFGLILPLLGFGLPTVFPVLV
ncbi:MAG: hypothetical protein ACRDO8_10175, partial [Nocardioidaceae bacterium]